MEDFSQMPFERIKEQIDLIANNKYVLGSESQWLELKASTNALEDSSNQICSFLNNKGRIILIGINEANNEIIGIKREITLKQILNSLTKKITHEYDENFEISFYEYNNNKLGWVRVKPLKRNFIVCEGRIYHKRNNFGESEFIQTKKGMEEFIINKIKNEIEIEDYLFLIKDIWNQLEILKKYRDPIKKIECFRGGIFPNPINYEEYKNLRKKIKVLLYNTQYYSLEENIYLDLRKIDTLLGKEKLNRSNLMTNEAHKRINFEFIPTNDTSYLHELINNIENLQRYLTKLK